MEKLKIYVAILLANGYSEVVTNHTYSKCGFKVDTDTLKRLSEKEFAERLIEVDQLIRGDINTILISNKELKNGFFAAKSIIEAAGLKPNSIIKEQYDLVIYTAKKYWNG